MALIDVESCPDSLHRSGFIDGDENVWEILDHLFLHPSSIRLHSTSHSILIKLHPQICLDFIIKRSFVKLDLVLRLNVQYADHVLSRNIQDLQPCTVNTLT